MSTTANDYPYRAGYRAGGPAFARYAKCRQLAMIQNEEHLERVAYSEAIADPSQRDYDAEDWPIWREGFVDRWIEEWERWRKTGVVRVELKAGVSGPSCSGTSCGVSSGGESGPAPKRRKRARE